MKTLFLTLLLFTALSITAPAAETADGKKLDIHFVPTPEEVVEEMLGLAKITRDDVVYDLGCGDGRIVITAVKKHGARKGVGIDLDPARIADSKANAQAQGVTDKISFLQQNIFETDISEASVVTLYLLRSINERLRPKLFQQLKPGTRIASHAFTMGDWEADEHRKVPDSDAIISRDVYFWVLPANASGKWHLSTTRDGKPASLSLNLSQQYQKLRGTAVEDGTSYAVENGRVNGRQVTFAVRSPGGATATFTGELDGDTLRGNVASAGTASATAGVSWEAKREPGTAQPSADMPAAAKQAAAGVPPGPPGL